MIDQRQITMIIIGLAVISLVLSAVANTFLVYAQVETKYKAKLIGDSAVPPVNTTAAGRAVIFVGNDWLWWKLNVTGITDPTMAHMHMGVKGENGAIFVHLLRSAHFENTTERMIISGNISASDLQGPMQGKTFDDLQSLFKSLGAYIDLHTKDHPDGELRGTIKIQGGNATKDWV
ncbi:MAG TPA: CHRD domain-containing protein [Nitrososphaeraceae archaeon]